MTRCTLIVLLLLLLPAVALAGRHGMAGRPEGADAGQAPERRGAFAAGVGGGGAGASEFGPPGAGAAQARTAPESALKLPPGPRCYTDMELMAEVALRFIFLQESAARTCDPVLKLRDRRAERLMTRMNDEIVERFAFNLEKYQTAHEARVKRWYGELWQRALEQERRLIQQKFLKDLRLLPGTCANMRKELEIILNSGWHYLGAKINFEAEEIRPASRMCKPGG